MLMHRSNSIQIATHGGRAHTASGRCALAGAGKRAGRRTGRCAGTAVAIIARTVRRLHSGHFAFMFVQMRTQKIMIPLTLTLALLCTGVLLPLQTQGARGQQQTAQQQTAQQQAEQSDPDRPARELLLGAKDAVSSGNLRYLRPHLGKKVYLNLMTGINGYYSGEQAFLILESLFSTYIPISFSFSSRNFSIRNPYGFGPLTYERRGKRDTAEMFLSLANVNGEWMINHISIAKR